MEMENMKGLSVAQIIKEYKELECWSFRSGTKRG